MPERFGYVDGSPPAGFALGAEPLRVASSQAKQDQEQQQHELQEQQQHQCRCGASEPARARYDCMLPVRWRDTLGLWVKGTPTKVCVYSVGGEKVMVLALPSTALASILCSKASSWFIVPPNGCTFAILGKTARHDIITDESFTPLCWWARFEPAISVQVQLIPVNTDYVDDGSREFGWRPVRHWRRLVAAATGFELDHTMNFEWHVQR